MAISDVKNMHGGKVFQAARDLGLSLEQILDFSASINPLGMADRVWQSATDAIKTSIHYPEVDAASFVDSLTEYHELSHANFLAGCGSTELIYLVPRCFKPKKALIVTPAFSEYTRALQQVGCKIIEFPLLATDDFSFDAKAVLAAVDKKTDVVIVANPGNPTGVGIERKELQLLADGLPETTLLVVDEAFVDFCPEKSIIEEVNERKNLLVLRSLTKFYAIPGLRAGYLAGPDDKVRQLAAASEPWSLSTPAIAAARACLFEDEYRQKTLKLIPQWRQHLIDGLSVLDLHVFPSSANYLLVKLPQNGRTSGTVTRVLYQQGILVRDCSDFSSLDERYFRVAVRGAQENLRLLGGIKGVLL